MGYVTDKSADVYRDFNTAGVPASGPHEPAKSEIRTLFSAVDVAIGAAQAGLMTVETIAARDTFYATEANRGKLVYVNNNNGSSTDPANGVYEYVGGARLAQSFYTGLASVVQPLVDQAAASAATATAAAGTATAAALASGAQSIVVSRAAFGPVNIFDRSAITDESTMNSAGVTSSLVGWFVTPFMPVQPGSKVIFNAATGAGSSIPLIFFAADRTTIVSRISNTTAGVAVDVPAGAAWVRTSLNKALSNGTPSAFMAVWGDVLPSTYRPFGVPIPSDLLNSVRSDVLPLYVDGTTNLILAQNTLADRYVQPDAVTTTADASWVTVVVPVKPGGQVTVWYKPNQGYFWETAEGARIGGTVPAPTSVFPVGGFTLTAPAGAVKLYYGVPKTTMSNAQIIDGAGPLKSRFSTTLARLSDAHPWAGRAIVVKSDSRAQEKAWLGILGTNLGANVINWSRGGQGMGHALTVYVPAYIDAGAVVPTVDRAMVQADLATVDALLLSLTYNSSYNQQPIGNFDDVVPDAGSTTVMPVNFIPAMRYAIRTYRAWNPNIFVGVYGTQHRFEGSTDAIGTAVDQRQKDYRLIEQQICLEESVPYLDFMTESGFSRANIATDWPDKVHPSDSAHARRTEPTIRAWLETKRPLVA